MAADTRPSLTCRELAELVTDYLEDALGAEERARFERHIDRCPMCQVHLGQLRVTLAELGTLTEDDIPPAFMAELRERFRDWRARGDGPSSS
jgi:anti-sigma factor RsiW